MPSAKPRHGESPLVEELHGRVDFAVITIRQDEATAVTRRLGERQVVRGRRDYSLTYLEHLGDAEPLCVISVQSDEGQTEAQHVTTDLIADFDPQWILLVGICGSIPNNDFTLGDVILGRRALDFSVMAAIEGGQFELNARGEPAHPDVESFLGIPGLSESIPPWGDRASIGMPTPRVALPAGTNDPMLYGNDAWKATVIRSLERHWRAGARRRDRNLWYGTVATSNTLVKDSTLALRVNQAARKATSFEMELFGVMRAARGRDKHYPVLSIRSVSDIIGLDRAPEWTAFAANAAASCMFSILRSGFPRMPRQRQPSQGSVPKSRSSESGSGANLSAVCADLLERSERRDDFLTHLPRIPVPCSGVLVRPGVDGEPHRSQVDSSDVQSVLDEFVAADEGLLVVLGVFGSGKSEVLRQLARAALPQEMFPVLVNFADIADLVKSMDAADAVSKVLAESSSQASREFLATLADEPNRILMLIDAYDEANLSYDDENWVPGSAWLTQLLAGSLRVVLSARRTAALQPESFMTAIGQPAVRREGSVGRSYQIIELGPCQQEAVLQSLDSLPESKAATVRRYLEADSRLQMESARRPLFLQMVADMDIGDLKAGDVITLYRLYDLYVEKTLERDHKSGASQIPVNVKRLILDDVAHAMFVHQIEKGAARISTTDAATLIVARNAPNMSTAYGENASEAARNKRAWFADFERSNHILVPDGIGRSSLKARAFVHHTLFEFFLAQHFATNVVTEGTFRLADDPRALRAFDSLLPYFLRALLGNREDDLVNLVRSDEASNIDRLLAFFFLEDSPQMVDRLSSMPESYLSFLRLTESSSDSFFMQKVARFQLILLDQSLGRALWYVSDIRVREVEQHVDIEALTFGDQRNPTDFLLDRLSNPVLKAAAPIFVYRLGQRGDRRAIEKLEPYLDHGDPAFAAIAREAIGRIEERHKVRA